MKKITNKYGFLEYMQVFETIDIINIEVLPEYRRKGIATSFLNSLVAENEGVQEIFLEVRKSNEPAIKLYKKNGFEIISERNNYYKNPTEDALIMSLFVSKNSN